MMICLTNRYCAKDGGGDIGQFIMAQKRAKPLPLAKSLRLTDVMGLIPSPRRKDDHPFRWIRPETGRQPEWVRWVWLPQTGEMCVGRVIHHYEFLGKARMYQFNEWVRGFYFPKARLVAVRTYFNHHDPYDTFDAAYQKLNERISQHVVKLLRTILPTARFVTGVDNNWLETRFPGLCQW